ncbi:MAG: ABC transporter ATP-binding protein [Phycisphaerales bacterium]|nr:ABC transporter ATP-binding protein [Phycisphaerales bacterium]
MRPVDSTSRTPVVLAQGLTKVFSDFWLRAQVRAVDNLDLRIEPGQIFGLIGPNGSGKSTTIKMILGLLHKTSGRLSVLGKQPSDIAAKKRIGYLPEESYLYQFLNSRETLDFYAKLFGYPRAIRRRRIDELLEMVGLDAVAHRPVGQFSKGMQRRVGIAQALINDPEFLILDEPTSGLDPLGIRQVKDLIIDLGKRGKTILLSSHLLSEVEDVCDSMTILYGGKKRAEGTRDELLTADDRTIIETEALSQTQADEIAEFIEQKEGRRIIRVAPARQSLESLFMSIVEKAQAERVKTSGAGRGGPTAAFLRGVEPDAERSGDKVIADLMKEPEVPAASRAERPAADQPRQAGEPNQSVLDSLVDGGQAPAARQGDRSKAPAPKREAPAEDVDRSVLDSLMGGSQESPGESREER